MNTQAVIIAIGSELISGQITNRNAPWIASKLLNYGIEVREHVTVDDIESDILRTLHRAAELGSLIFITGGLGPTTDDLTRDAVAAWADEPLEYHPPSWKHITDIFGRLGIKPPEQNKRQCYFPRAASILKNEVGTANAFQVTKDGVRAFVLPGPPHELEHIWFEHIDAELAAMVPVNERRLLKMWRTIGRGESHIAEMIEPLVSPYQNPGNGLEVAYRAHAPYIELKLRFRLTDAAYLAPLFALIDAALEPWLFERDLDNVIENLAHVLGQYKTVAIYDAACRGEVFEMLGPYLRTTPKSPTSLSLITTMEESHGTRTLAEEWLNLSQDTDLALIVTNHVEQGLWICGARLGNKITVFEKPAPYPGQHLKRRNEKAMAALAIKAWAGALRLKS